MCSIRVHFDTLRGGCVPQFGNALLFNFSLIWQVLFQEGIDLFRGHGEAAVTSADYGMIHHVPTVVTDHRAQCLVQFTSHMPPTL